MSAKKCGCGNTKDPNGNCDGSHAQKPATPPAGGKKCACGKTKNPEGSATVRTRSEGAGNAVPLTSCAA